ncbi:MAG: hypothetical protein EOO04_14000, partial [Chitinophagaceae bacterium]
MNEENIKLPFDIALLPLRSLQAGEISCVYEKGNLRQIRFDKEEIVRMIYPAVRGTNWETALSEIEDEKIDSHEKSFKISYLAKFQLDKIKYQTKITITGKEDNSISFIMRGEALSKFETRRIGLCVHHPVKECKGKEVIITRPDHTVYSAQFPNEISAHQPFTDIREMQWTNNPDHQVRLIFKGEVFETEDQRNWGDNSYKTYGTPLGRPAPVTINKGETLEQQIKLSIIKKSIAGTKEAGLAADWKEEKIPLPKIGYCRLPGSRPLTAHEIVALNNVPFDHYRVEIFMTSVNWRHELNLAISEAKKLGTSLELVVFFSDSIQAETLQLIDELRNPESRVVSILPLHADSDVTPVNMIRPFYAKIKKHFPHISIGYGTNAFFAELNRNRPVNVDYDFVSISLNPQVHARDTRTIVENLESQRQIVEAIRQFTTKPVHISPLTFQQRTDGIADQRLQTYFGAWWTAMSIKNLCQAASITLFETTGERGIINNSDFAYPERSPVFDMLAKLKSFQPLFVIRPNNEHVVIFENETGKRLIYSVIINHTSNLK